MTAGDFCITSFASTQLAAFLAQSWASSTMDSTIYAAAAQQRPIRGVDDGITLPSFAVDELRRLKAEQAEEFLKLGIPHSGEMFVCGRFDGEPMQPDTLTFLFARTMKEITSVPRVRFHDLRHTHATQLLLSGVHPKVAQERLGHSSVKVTLDIYSHVLESMQNDAAEKLDNVFRSAINANPAGTAKK